MGEIMVQL